MKKRTYNLLLSLLVLSTAGTYWLLDGFSQLKETKDFPSERVRVPAPKVDKPDEFIKFMTQLRTRAGEDSPGYTSGYKLNELAKARKNVAGARLSAALEFIERGPGNVPGRTRALIVDPDDANHLTFYAGGVGGGVWKTTDGGTSWINKTDNLPNLAISWLVMAESNHDIIYAGTGEGWGASSGFIKGSGIYKSTDRGETWTLLSATQNEDFQIVNRLVVDPLNPDIILAATSNDAKNALSFNSGIFKSTDGGASWTRKFTGQRWVQQIVASPNDFSILYATVNGIGVYKSTDAGETWNISSNGLSASGRIEMAVSPVAPNNLFASVVGSVSGTGSDLFFSDDGGNNWLPTKNLSGTEIDFLGGQGWYDNTILAHPFIANEVYVGGVNLWKFDVKAGTVLDRKFIDAEEQGTQSFMSLINYSAEYYGGRIDVGDTIAETFVSVEVRFGPDVVNGGYLKQYAHRFTIPVGQGSGVPAADYTFQDYVEVPFQVWDVDNNRQLMVSFRDQQDDGVFNLKLTNTDNADAVNNSREYIFISNIDYNGATPDPNMSANGQHEFKNLYFFWPVLANGAVWDETSLPASKFIITHDVVFEKKEIASKSVADAYGQFSGPNGFTQTTGSTSPQGLHPDHHNLVPIIWDEAAESFQLLVANDGGVYRSGVSVNPGESDGSWQVAGLTYNTSQFYAVDKAPGANRYIGGLQDNGSWMTVPGEDASASSAYRRAGAGDGFGTAWNHARPDELLTTVYYNDIRKSTNGGVSSTSSISGLLDVGSEKGPFITKIESLHSDPNRVFAVGISGVWQSMDFGGIWQLAPISNQWVPNPDIPFMPSSTRVRISQANSHIIWAGWGMQETGTKVSLHVSVDEGNSFSPVNNFTDVTLGNISGLATHPILDSTAFALFSFAQGPKILRTDNLGTTWYDISGFGTGTVSTNGFPDVAVYDLLVMPYDTTIIWAGTEIGIFESSDAGATWHILNANMPATSIWDLKIVDDQVVVGTHGRGIWSATIAELPGQVYLPDVVGASPALTGDLTFDIYAHSAYDSIHLYVGGTLVARQSQSSVPGIVKVATNYNASLSDTVYARAFYQGKPYVSHDFIFTTENYKPVVDSYENDFNTPSDDFFGFGFSERSETGFSGMAIHSEHFPASGVFYQYILKSPIRVRSTNAWINFSEVVLMEPGNTKDALPGTPEFNDYVVVQGSKDGINWVNLLDEYDANYREDWLVSYIKGENGVKELYKFRAIDLLETFAPNDEVLIRFALSSNLVIEGWGWTIDNLKIQTADVITGITENQLEDFAVYPNPVVANSFNIKAPNTIGSAMLRMYDLNGRQVLKSKVKLSNQERVLLPTSIKDGLYTIILSTNDYRASHKIIIQRNK